MTRVLIIGYVWPEPRSSAAGSHMMGLIHCFRQQGWQITFASPAAISPHMEDLQALDIPAVSIALNCSSFDEFVGDLQPDIVLFDRFMMEEQFGWRVEKHCPNALRMLDTEDLHSLRNARHQALKQQREMTRQDLLSEMAQREVAAIYRCDLTLIISDYEKQLLETEFGVSPDLLLHLPFMLDSSKLEQPRPAFEERQHFVTIGNFRHAPNWDAVLQLKQLWPKIRKQLPDAELHVYGAYPPKKATDLHQPKSGFLVKGWAEDANEVVRDARVMLAPLRFGAGIKGKLVEAMLNGTPSVTTPIGAEAMYGELPWNGLIANDDTGFINGAVELYQNPELWQQSQQNGDSIIQQRYPAQPLQTKLLARIETLRNRLAAHRLNNFTGAMLRHHHQRSTQFMSQWIETKTKLAELSGDAD